MTKDVEVLRAWIRFALVIATVATTAFPVLYAFTPWRSRPIGRLLMLQGVSLAVSMQLSTLLSFWRPKNILVIFWIQAFILTAIAVSTSLLTLWMWRMNGPYRKRIKHMTFMLSGKAYDFAKWVALVWLPAFGTLYFALAGIWYLPNADEVSGTVLALDTFLGVILGISTKTYNGSEAKYDGTVDVVTTDGGGKQYQLNMNGDPSDLDQKDEIRFKVNSPPFPMDRK